MSSIMTQDEIRQRYAEAMGAELGEIFHALSNEVTWIHWRWKQYQTLYGAGRDRVDLLNASAPLFFRIIQDVLIEDTILSLARLSDPPRTAGKDNLSIGRLVPLLNGKALNVNVDDLVQNARTSSEFARDWRHRRLAHRDLNLILGRGADPLPSVTQDQIDKALADLRCLLNDVQHAFGLGVTVYEMSPTTGDAEMLLYALVDAKRRRAEKEACWDRGEDHPDDRDPPKLP